MVRGFLEARGIEAAIASDDCGATDPSLQVSNQVQLVVGSADVEQARELMDRADDGDFADEVGGEG